MPDLDDLMAAVVSGSLPEVRSILDAPGAAPAIFDGQEDTVIWMACMHAGPQDCNTIEREGIVNALLRAGAPSRISNLRVARLTAAGPPSEAREGALLPR